MISVVIPAFREGERVKKGVKKLAQLLSNLENYELVVVVEKGDLKTLENVKEAVINLNTPLKVVLVREKAGKGESLVRGVLEAKGEKILLVDADLPFKTGDLKRVLRKLERYDLVLASRYLKGSKRVGVPPYRILASRIFNLLTRILFRELREFSDTQCGLKAARKKPLEQALKCVFIGDYVFDVNLIYAFKLLGMKTTEIPVTYLHAPGSKITPLNIIPTSTRMLASLLTLKAHAHLVKKCIQRVRREIGPPV